MKTSQHQSNQNICYLGLLATLRCIFPWPIPKIHKDFVTCFYIFCNCIFYLIHFNHKFSLKIYFTTVYEIKIPLISREFVPIQGRFGFKLYQVHLSKRRSKEDLVFFNTSLPSNSKNVQTHNGASWWPTTILSSLEWLPDEHGFFLQASAWRKIVYRCDIR